MNMKNLLPFTNGFHSRYQKSKILKERRVFIFSLPDANVEPKCDYSINKSFKSIHGYFTKDQTIAALRFVKEFIERGGIGKVKVTQNLLRLCGRTRERYGAFLK